MANPQKTHDIFDDLESLLWTLLYIALHFFTHTGAASITQMFDEIREDSNTSMGRIRTGGTSKLAWLSRPGVSFECKPLQKFFTSFREFHRKYQTEWTNAGDDEDDEDFKAYCAQIMENIHALTSHFDDALEVSDWSAQQVCANLLKNLTLNEERKLIGQNHRAAIKKRTEAERGEVDDSKGPKGDQKEQKTSRKRPRCSSDTDDRVVRRPRLSSAVDTDNHKTELNVHTTLRRSNRRKN